jgi:hypothetical protein
VETGFDPASSLKAGLKEMIFRRTKQKPDHKLAAHLIDNLFLTPLAKDKKLTALGLLGS